MGRTAVTTWTWQPDVLSTTHEQLTHNSTPCIQSVMQRSRPKHTSVSRECVSRPAVDVRRVGLESRHVGSGLGLASSSKGQICWQLAG